MYKPKTGDGWILQDHTTNAPDIEINSMIVKLGTLVVTFHVNYIAQMSIYPQLSVYVTNFSSKVQHLTTTEIRRFREYYEITFRVQIKMNDLL